MDSASVGNRLSKLKTRFGEELNFTRIPNELLRSKVLDLYDKIVFCIIESFHPSFPSYAKIMELTGISKERLWKSLKNLEKHRLIFRIKNGRGVQYFTYISEDLRKIPANRIISFRETISSPDEPTSSPDELEPVRQTNTNKTNEKDQFKNSDVNVSKSKIQGMVHKLFS